MLSSPASPNRRHGVPELPHHLDHQTLPFCQASSHGLSPLFPWLGEAGVLFGYWLLLMSSPNMFWYEVLQRRHPHPPFHAVYGPSTSGGGSTALPSATGTRVHVQRWRGVALLTFDLSGHPM